MVGGLQTWTRELRYQPPVHDLVPGEGRSADDRWLPSRPDCLVPVTPLAGLCRATCRDALHQTALVPLVDAPLWHKDGVGHGALGGRGVAAWRSRSPSIFRVASSHNRLLTLPEGHVTSQDKASATAQVKPGTLPAAECMRRFLQPGRPPRCIQGRDDGMRSPTNRPGLTRARARRGAGPVEADPTGHHRPLRAPTEARALPRCPRCGRTLILVQTLRPPGRAPPCR